MKIIFSKHNVPIRITDERMVHIINNHPEMCGHEDRIIETITNPDIIFAGDFGEFLAVKLYIKTPVSENKYLIAAYKGINENDGFLITAYFSRRLGNWRKIIWKP